MLTADKIKKCATQAGFTLCGVARCRVLTEHASRFADGLEASGERALRYLVDRAERRLDPSHLVAGAKTVIVCAVNYRNEYSSGYAEGFQNPKICSYALSTEYQPKIKAMLSGVLEMLKADHPVLSGRVFCDTSPILEKAWAVESGLGWIGKQSLLINPDYGSSLLLGEIVVDAECDRYDDPYSGNGCGGCSLCLDSCPVGALPSPRTLDTGRCISALSIEKVGGFVSSQQMHGWIFGCDECQSICPFNIGKPMCDNPDFMPLIDPSEFSANRLRAMDEGEFRKLFAGTPLLRTGLERIKNILSAKK